MLLCVFMYPKMDNIFTHHMDLNSYFGGEKIIFPNAFRHGYYFFSPYFKALPIVTDVGLFWQFHLIVLTIRSKVHLGLADY